MKRAAIYAFYDPHGVVADYVVYMLKHLRAHADLVVVVCNGHVDEAGQEKLRAHSDAVHLRENVGFDIHGFRAGLIEYIGWQKLAAYDEVVLLNSTFYGPIFPLAEMFGEMDRRTTTDFWGITAFKGPVPNGFTGVGMLPFHIQSYFTAFRRRVFQTKAFQEYWRKLPPLKSYVDAVLIHETQFTELLSHHGFRYSLYCDPKDYGAINPSFDMLDVLLERRCPVLKRRAFFHEPLYLELNNVELARALELIRTNSDYDPSLIWRDITKIAKPHDLYTNATLLEVPSPGKQAAKPRANAKVAVLAHVTSRPLFDELAARLRSIPVAFDLHLTTSDAALEAELKTVPGAEVRRVDPRGADVSALVIGQRDLLRDGGYDWICRLHTSPSTGTAFPRSRHFREHHYGNLLADPGYVARLFEMFERDPCLGIIAPPAVHIAHSAARGQHDGAAARWAKTLGIQAPLDTYTPEMPTASMFWCRPQALDVITRHPFTAADFGAPAAGEEPLERVVLRLLLPAIQQSGYFAKAVLTPVNLAKNYVKLEYKLANAIGAPRPAPTNGGPRFPFPEQQISDFVRERLKDSPTALGVAQGLVKFVGARLNRGAAR